MRFLFLTCVFSVWLAKESHAQRYRFFGTPRELKETVLDDPSDSYKFTPVLSVTSTHHSITVQMNGINETDFLGILDDRRFPRREYSENNILEFGGLQESTNYYIEVIDRRLGPLFNFNCMTQAAIQAPLELRVVDVNLTSVTLEWANVNGSLDEGIWQLQISGTDEDTFILPKRNLVVVTNLTEKETYKFTLTDLASRRMETVEVVLGEEKELVSRCTCKTSIFFPSLMFALGALILLVIVTIVLIWKVKCKRKKSEETGPIVPMKQTSQERNGCFDNSNENQEDDGDYLTPRKFGGFTPEPEHVYESVDDIYKNEPTYANR